MKFLFTVFLLLVGWNVAAEGASISANQLRCEYRTNPLGIDETAPRLSWILESDGRGQKQSAYRIVVSSSEVNLAAGEGDLWDTGKVNSNRSIHVVYGGKVLQSGMRCFWKVRVWDKDGKASSWSKPAWWEMALLNSDDWGGVWINDGKSLPERDEDFYKDDPAPLFRRQFKLDKDIKLARLYISGLGYYEAFLNGGRVGDHVLDPGWTDYSARVYYSSYDVTGQLSKGDNCLGVIVGNGWYNPLPLRMWGWLNLREHLTIGRGRFIAQLNVEFADGSRQSVVSDETWKVGEGPIVRNNIYLGEVYDARREIGGWNLVGFDDSVWRGAKAATEEIGKLVAQPLEAIKITATVRPVKVTEPKPDIFIFDMGQNFAGWVSLKLRAATGTRINLRYGELLREDGTLNPMTSVCGQIKGTGKAKGDTEVNIGGPGSLKIAWQGDTYIAKGGGEEEYRPRFTFHAFRYVEVTGLEDRPSVDAVAGLRLNSAVAEAGEFACSNELFNKIQKMCRWTFLSNIFSVQSDCPHRERFSYGGDLVCTSDSFMLNFDMANFYSKAVWDWHDSALDNGMLTDTSPFVGIGYCGPAWTMVHPHLQLQLYQYYGDRRIMERQYETSRRWLDLVAENNKDHIINEGLSDHEGLAPAPSAAMITPLYCQSAGMLAAIARILGRGDDAEKYEDLVAKIKKAYVGKFLQPDTGIFEPGTQASQSFGLYLNMSDDKTVRQKAIEFLINDIKNKRKGHLSTGIFGTRFMLDVLSREGHADVAYNIVNQRTFPGWGYMLEKGATTLWEHWAFSDNTFSHNHPMFGSVSQWFFNWLGGIQPDRQAVGFDRIIIRPQVIDDLQWVRSSYNSVRGRIESNWRREDGRLYFAVKIPANTKAMVYLPVGEGESVMESGNDAKSAEGIRFVKKDNGVQTYQAGSGRYLFVISK